MSQLLSYRDPGNTLVVTDYRGEDSYRLELTGAPRAPALGL